MTIASKSEADPTTQGHVLPWDYAPAPESVKVDIADRYGLFIGGRWVEAAESFATVSPSTEVVLAHVGQASPADVNAAVTAAREALPAWASLPGRERGKYLYRIARRIQERARELAVLETMDGGKPIKESRDLDIPLAAAHFFYHGGWADKLRYAFPGREPKPVGVCGQIIPWNFPLLMAAWKIAPALACGNTVVLKPAETTPLTALRLAEICDEIGLPPGVVNIITGDGRTGEALVKHPGLDKIAFTGSTEVGKRIARAAAEEQLPTPQGRKIPKRLTLELGGKSPHIIFEDASLDQAVEGIVQGIFFNQGHVCCAGSRVFIQESVLDETLDRLARRMSTLRVGDPLDKNTDVGAINSKAQYETITRYLDTGVGEGAELVVPGGAAHEPQAVTAGFDQGYFCRPSFFRSVQPSHRVAREEIFGPVLAVLSFRTPAEAIQRANNTRYGLAAGVWTDKGSKIFELAAKLDAGIVWLNTYNRFDPTSPFGGYKESGFGREGGLHGLRAYVST
jgi:aldehyde dehydrogenase (NAD+)